MDSVNRNTERTAAAPRRGRPRAFDRDAAVRAALDVFWDKGFDGAQLADLNAAMGINPPSFYAAFTSKEQLFREAVALYIAMQEARIGPPFDRASTAKDALRAQLETSADIAMSAPGARGCLLILGVTNNIPGNAPLRTLLQERRIETRERMRVRLARGVADGDLPVDADVDGLARFLAATLQGISIQARDGATRGELQSIIDQALSALEGPAPRLV